MLSAESSSSAILPDPPEHLKELSERLCERVRERIRQHGPLPFADYMEMALYEPGLGYYSAGLHKFGAAGDFVTAPELGGVFARCLATQAGEIGQQLGAWDLLEIGAGSGRQAADLLNALPADCRPARYLILERSADLRRVQQAHLREHAPAVAGIVEWLDRPPDEPWRGVLIANEVLDALPTECFELQGGAVQQLCVAEVGAGFGWVARPAPGPLGSRVLEVLGEHPGALPDGYRSELCALLPGWLRTVTESLQAGVALFIDYGYPRREYYLPERSMGTLVCHYRHRAHADPFLWPGLQDISAFVDFTALAEAGEACGMECAGYTSQAMFLLGSGLAGELERLATLPDLERLRLAHEIRELTLPGAMGERFQCMALSRGYNAPLRGFSERDLRGRL